MKLVLLVLLVLVVVLERGENLVLREMLGLLGLRYINSTWDLTGAVPPALHRTLCSGSGLAALITLLYLFSRALLEELEALATRVKWWVLSTSLPLLHSVGEGHCSDW